MDKAELTGKDRTKLTEEILRLQQRMGHSLAQPGPGVWMDLNLTIAQLKSLFFIDFEGQTNSSNLANALNVTPPNITGIIDRLAEHGLVSREQNPENRRMSILQTTEKGRTLIAQLRERGITRTSGILSRLSTEELIALFQGLSAVVREIELQQKEKQGEKNE